VEEDYGPENTTAFKSQQSELKIKVVVKQLLRSAETLRVLNAKQNRKWQNLAHSFKM